MIKNWEWNGLIKIFKLKSIISIKDFERKDIDYILDEASKLEDIAKSKECCDELKGKILGLMFLNHLQEQDYFIWNIYETFRRKLHRYWKYKIMFCFQGESIADTAKMLEGYSDALVIRHELKRI